MKKWFVLLVALMTLVACAASGKVSHVPYALQTTPPGMFAASVSASGSSAEAEVENPPDDHPAPAPTVTPRRRHVPTAVATADADDGSDDVPPPPGSDPSAKRTPKPAVTTFLLPGRRTGVLSPDAYVTRSVLEPAFVPPVAGFTVTFRNNCRGQTAAKFKRYMAVQWNNPASRLVPCSAYDEAAWSTITDQMSGNTIKVLAPGVEVCMTMPLAHCQPTGCKSSITLRGYSYSNTAVPAGEDISGVISFPSSNAKAFMCDY